MTVEATVTEMRAVVELAQIDAQPGEAQARAGRELRIKTLNVSLRERYERLLQTVRDPVVPIVSGSCTGCHLRLPTMVDAQARRGAVMHACPHCSRLLYVPRVVDPSAASHPPIASPRPVRPRSGSHVPASGARS